MHEFEAVVDRSVFFQRYDVGQDHRGRAVESQHAVDDASSAPLHAFVYESYALVKHGAMHNVYTVTVVGTDAYGGIATWNVIVTEIGGSTPGGIGATVYAN